MEKSYRVFYYLKMNRQEILKNMDIVASNQKEACKKCKEIVFTQTGRNAFRPTTKDPKTAKE